MKKGALTGGGGIIAHGGTVLAATRTAEASGLITALRTTLAPRHAWSATPGKPDSGTTSSIGGVACSPSASTAWAYPAPAARH